MMNVEVMFFGKLRETAGTSKEQASLEAGGKLSDLMSCLEKTHGAKFAEEVRGIKGLRILINGREYQVLDGVETVLKEKDSVVLLPPIEGG